MGFTEIIQTQQNFNDFVMNLCLNYEETMMKYDKTLFLLKLFNVELAPMHKFDAKFIISTNDVENIFIKI